MTHPMISRLVERNCQARQLADKAATERGTGQRPPDGPPPVRR